MSLGEKLKDIRKRFGLSQEELAEIMKVSRQAITKWESNGGLPDITNLQELSKVFGVTIDYLINDNTTLPALSMKRKLDKDKYKSKISSYEVILKELYPSPWQVYSLIREKKLSKMEATFDFIIGAGTVNLADVLGNMSPYYLVIKDDLKMLINIKDWELTIYELPTDINVKKFVFMNNKFTRGGQIKLD